MPPRVGGAQKSAAAGILNNRPTMDSSGTVMKGEPWGTWEHAHLCRKRAAGSN